MKIEQLLYGYDDGHTLLTGSILINSAADSARLAMLSDWSGYRTTNDDDSYLTAFPLVDSPHYAVAKSWYAYEMERPGCVWTQVFLINLSEIDNQFDFRSLLSFFQRPKRGAYSLYSQTLDIDINKSIYKDPVPKFTDDVSLLFIYNTLLNANGCFGIKVERQSSENQLFVLNLMQYLPVGLLQKLSFSTGSDTYRQLDKETLLTMQFVQQDNAVSLISPPWTMDISKDNFPQSIQFMCNACKEGNTELARMIRVFADDISDSVKKFTAFACLMKYLYSGAGKSRVTDSYTDILSILIENFPDKKEGALLKLNFLSQRIVSLYCSEAEFLYEICTLRNLESFSKDEFNYETRIDLLAQKQPLDFINLLVRISETDIINEAGQYAMNNSFRKIDNHMLTDFAEKNWRSFVNIAMLNPEYVNRGDWIDYPKDRFNDMMACFVIMDRSLFCNWNKLLIRVLVDHITLSRQIAEELFLNADNAAKIILDYLNKENTKPIDATLTKKACENSNLLLSWLSQQKTCSDLVEQILINNIIPASQIVRQYGSGLWQCLVVKDNNHKSIDYYLFLFELAFQWQDNNALLYLECSFYHIHEALRHSSAKVWDAVYTYTESLPFWQEWDKCKKLRKGVVKYLKRSGYNRSILIDFTPDKDLNQQLLKIWNN
jgi:hypothetical protein